MQIDEAKVIKVTNERYRLNYHLSPNSGWMNDPNGFVYFKGYYHIFYQYYPYDSQWGPMHWGHARSHDLIHWEQLPAALVPGDREDEDGCFSGSAIVKDDKLFLIYTGHHYYDKNDPDNFWQNQNLAFSSDGVHFTKYENNPIIATPPKDNTIHFRDPKVWEHDGKYYVVIGSQNEEKLGRILMYISNDLFEWEFKGTIAESKSSFEEGFMWECPDLFRLNGKDILLFSPQGIKAQKQKYLNLFQTGYFIGDFNYQKANYKHHEFVELDHGHDFYATQTMLAPDGRRIVFGWMDMWEANMPEQADGWAGALTLPRELTLKDDHLYMNPVEEVKNIRTEKAFKKITDMNECSFGKFNKRGLELDFVFENLYEKLGNFEFILRSEKENKFYLKMNFSTGNVTLYKKGKDPYRYASFSNKESGNLRVFMDASSIEIFINDGETVFSERLYFDESTEILIRKDNKLNINAEVYELNIHGGNSNEQD